MNDIAILLYYELVSWTVEPLNVAVERELLALPPDCRAAFVRLSELLIEHGPVNVETGSGLGT